MEKINLPTSDDIAQEKELIEASEELGRGEKKTLHTDYLKRIVHGLDLFYEANERMPRDLKLPLTGMYIIRLFLHSLSQNLLYLFHSS